MFSLGRRWIISAVVFVGSVISVLVLFSDWRRVKAANDRLRSYRSGRQDFDQIIAHGVQAVVDTDDFEAVVNAVRRQ